MALTIEEIQQGVSENPELKTQLLAHFEPDATEYFKGKGFEFLTADQKSQLLKSHEDSVINPRVSEIYSKLDADIFESTGIEKAPNEKTYVYAKRAIAELKTKGVTDEATQQRIAALQNELDGAKGSVAAKEAEFAAERMGWKVDGAFGSAFSSLKVTVPGGVAEKDAESYVQNRQEMLKNALLAKYTPVEQDGKILYKGKDGQFAMQGGNYATAKDLLQSEFKYDFDGVQRNGTGSGGGQQRGTQLVGITDKAGIYAHVKKEGIVSGSPAFFERTKAIAEQLNISLD